MVLLWAPIPWWPSATEVPNQFCYVQYVLVVHVLRGRRCSNAVVIWCFTLNLPTLPRYGESVTATASTYHILCCAVHMEQIIFEPYVQYKKDWYPSSLLHVPRRSWGNWWAKYILLIFLNTFHFSQLITLTQLFCSSHSLVFLTMYPQIFVLHFKHYIQSSYWRSLLAVLLSLRDKTVMSSKMSMSCKSWVRFLLVRPYEKRSRVLIPHTELL